MATSGKQQIPADVSQGSGPSENPVTFVDEEGKIQVAPELFAAMKKETLQILQEVEKSYSSNLGPRHALIRDVQRRINSQREQDGLREQDGQREQDGHREQDSQREQDDTLWGRLRRWFHTFTSLLTRDTVEDEDETDSNPES